MSEENNNDQEQLTLQSGPIEITPDKFLGILQEGRELEAITTGNFTLRELKNIKFFFIEFIEGLMMDKLNQEDEEIFKEVKQEFEEYKNDLDFESSKQKADIFENYFKANYEFEKVFDSRDYPEDMQDEVEDFISDLLNGAPEAEIDELNKEAEKIKKEQGNKNKKDNVVNLADYKKE